MKAFHNDPKIRATYMKRVAAHQKADELVKGKYWENGKGCAVGCTIHGDDHAAYEVELGIPRELAHLEDGIFEHLPNEDAQQWPLKFLKAIDVGVDLTRVHYQFCAWLLSEESGLLSITDTNRRAIADVRSLHQRASIGELVADKEWSAARSAAWLAAALAAESAARSAAWSAAASAAWSAAESAAESAAALAAASAAWSAAASAAESAAESAAALAAYRKMAEKLLELLSTARR